MKKTLLLSLLCLGFVVAPLSVVRAQDAAPVDNTELADNPSGAQPAAKKKDSTSLVAVMFGSGPIGVILWIALIGSGIAAIYFICDCLILYKAEKMIPQTLVDKVSEALNEGDVQKAIMACESEPGPLANILSAAFSHVTEGYDVIKEAIDAAADIENERVAQRINWISVCGNISPSLGLLGTVQGMIMAFEGLATGSPDVAALALAISQALWTTAGGLIVSIPSVTMFFVVRNNANRLVLRMQALTFELVKNLRNVEVEE